VNLIVNGKPRVVAGRPTLLELLEQLEIDPRIVAVERNGEIVKRGTFDRVQLEEGDRLEIVRMVGGG
jgi:thiamine biosynthesis protein ThiS